MQQIRPEDNCSEGKRKETSDRTGKLRHWRELDASEKKGYHDTHLRYLGREQIDYSIRHRQTAKFVEFVRLIEKSEAASLRQEYCDHGGRKQKLSVNQAAWLNAA